MSHTIIGRAAVVMLAAVALAPPAALGAPARASLPDLEDEVMCPTCGVPLENAFSPQAERERVFIRQRIAQGRTKEQIKQALVEEFGPDVLAVPRKSGFDLSAYIVPIAALVLAAIAVGLALLRWRQPRAAATEPTEIDPADAARLEQDLSRYDV